MCAPINVIFKLRQSHYDWISNSVRINGSGNNNDDDNNDNDNNSNDDDDDDDNNDNDDNDNDNNRLPQVNSILHRFVSEIR